METKKTSDDYLIFLRVAMAFDSGLGSSINTTFFLVCFLCFSRWQDQRSGQSSIYDMQSKNQPISVFDNSTDSYPRDIV